MSDLCWICLFFLTLTWIYKKVRGSRMEKWKMCLFRLKTVIYKRVHDISPHEQFPVAFNMITFVIYLGRRRVPRQWFLAWGSFPHSDIIESAISLKILLGKMHSVYSDQLKKQKNMNFIRKYYSSKQFSHTHLLINVWIKDSNNCFREVMVK